MYAIFRDKKLVTVTFQTDGYPADEGWVAVEIERAPEPWEVVGLDGTITEDLASYRAFQEERVSRDVGRPSFKDMEDMAKLMEATLFRATGHMGPLMRAEMAAHGTTAAEVADEIEDKDTMATRVQKRAEAVREIRDARNPAQVNSAVDNLRRWNKGVK